MLVCQTTYRSRSFSQVFRGKAAFSSPASFFLEKWSLPRSRKKFGGGVKNLPEVKTRGSENSDHSRKP